MRVNRFIEKKARIVRFKLIIHTNLDETQEFSGFMQKYAQATKIESKSGRPNPYLKSIGTNGNIPPEKKYTPEQMMGKRLNVFMELIDTERNYVTKLKALIDVIFHITAEF